MAWTVVNFGKYKGKNKTLPQIVFDDPDWFFWALGVGAFCGPLEAEADRLADRAQRIRIPDPDWRDLVAEYTTNVTLRRITSVRDVLFQPRLPRGRSANGRCVSVDPGSVAV